MTFEVGKTYDSAVQGVKFRVKMKFKVQDTDCLLVYRVTSTSPVFGVTSHYYPALIDDEMTATVLLGEGFTTIYAVGEE